MISSTSTPPRRNTAEAAAGARIAVGVESTERPRGASSSAVLEKDNHTTNGSNMGGGTPKRVLIAAGLKNPLIMNALRADSDGDRSSARDGSSDGANSHESPSDDNEARTRLVGKIEAAKQRLLQINNERERDLEEFIAMADKVEAAGGRDAPHMARIRQHYDRRNKKSSAQLDTVQKKLAQYEARLVDLDGGSPLDLSSRSSAHNVISSVGQGIRRTGANLKSMTNSVVTAPLEFAQKLKKSTIGSSSDNIEGVEHVGQSQFYSSSKSSSGLSSVQPASAKQKSSTLPANMRMAPPDLKAAAAAANSAGSGASTSAAGLPWLARGGEAGTASAPASAARPNNAKPGAKPAQQAEDAEVGGGSSLARLQPLGRTLLAVDTVAGEGKEGGSSTPESGTAAPFVFIPRLDDRPPLPTPGVMTEETLQMMLQEIKQLRQYNATIVEHMDKLQDKVQHDLARQEKLLSEERFKYQRLEFQLNEFTELHQAETSALKEDLQHIASRIDYQYNDRFKKVEENLESTQNHMFRVENSLRSSLEVKEGGPWFNALLLSGATILVELLKIGLYLTAVVLDFFRPFTGTRTKAGFFLLIIFISFIFAQNVHLLVDLFFPSTSSSSTATKANATVTPTVSPAVPVGETPPTAGPPS